MSTPLHDAAAKRLRAFGGSDLGGSVRRLSIDVEVDGRAETILISLRGDRLRCVSSDGSESGGHVEAALRFVAGLESADAAGTAIPSLGPAGNARGCAAR